MRIVIDLPEQKILQLIELLEKRMPKDNELKETRDAIVAGRLQALKREAKPGVSPHID